ncbi:choline monooxygenase, chloroplastic isoform X2 [Sorghum bicolor]|uniref:choline monooxygenase, chloroplastic isoform X2 n=1 Tax=Sorghum bicolor TaxID=4558 RepID=UPI000B425D7A|nr:choline monooxygenase, chloroplastic isoform X2 [Sorghum bicolor]|eukprot:XP_021304992.1 choline monooxygenase, chloroplastic isoform X2 [Sorghum bicolor]
MATGRSLAAVYSARASRTVPFRAGARPARAVAAAAAAEHVRRLVAEFDPAVPLDSAITPPSGWYTDPGFLQHELDRVFHRGWQAVGHIWQVKNPNDFFTGRLGNVEFVICRDADGKLHAFHNVCRHHASLLACGSGQKTCFQCPYHGWTYGLDGTLLKATRISGIRNFNKNDFGLIPIKVVTWGPFVLVRFDDESTEDNVYDAVGNEWLGSASDLLGTNGIDTSLPHICRREYIINCNWKVFCDNYLDGGYHVPYAHGALASGLQLQSYETLTYERVSVQRCESAPAEPDDFDRLGTKALYAFVYPNFMINRYGPWMDTNLAVPLDSTSCKDDESFIKKSLKDSEQVQIEDIALCEGVQRGLESPAYSVGRYAPSVEMAMHHFHCLIHGNLSG